MVMNWKWKKGKKKKMVTPWSNQKRMSALQISPYSGQRICKKKKRGGSKKGINRGSKDKGAEVQGAQAHGGGKVGEQTPTATQRPPTVRQNARGRKGTLPRKKRRTLRSLFVVRREINFRTYTKTMGP